MRLSSLEQGSGPAPPHLQPAAPAHPLHCLAPPPSSASVSWGSTEGSNEYGASTTRLGRLFLMWQLSAYQDGTHSASMMLWPFPASGEGGNGGGGGLGSSLGLVMESWDLYRGPAAAHVASCILSMWHI